MINAHVAELREQGYAVIRGFLSPEEVDEVRRATDTVYDEGVRHHATYRHQNLLFEVIEDPAIGKRVMPQAHWFSWINPTLERQRRSDKMFDVLAPLLGPDIKQISNQVHWKNPGGKFTYYRMHQDVRFRERPEMFANLDSHHITAGLALNRQGAAQGALKVVPRTHKRGNLGLSEDASIMVGNVEQGEELRAVGIDPAEVVQLELEAGDLVLWTLFTVHGSGPNMSSDPRILLINSYVRAEDSPDRGEWAFRDGRSVPLGDAPEVCKYEELHERPGPFYLDDDWTNESQKSGTG
ncbi:MAG: phytanoyl-CoA dioxygenase family protein [Pararhodobacter sp.]|nr:phytanoyl-CoA dioxygenase family protein [Pararhodobacter sp.]